MSREEIVALADEVSRWEGIASGIGTHSYSAQIVIEAPTSDEAVERAVEVFTAAAARAGLPPWPAAWAESVSEESELDELG